MKRKLLCLLSCLTIMLTFLLVSCSADVENSLVVQGEKKSKSQYSIGLPKAIEKANQILKLSRSDASKPRVEYVFKKYCGKATRPESQVSDTIAFIINYPNDRGFVIVANDVRINPILAYSDNGYYSTDNELAQSEFIDRIQNYIYSKASTKSEPLIISDNTELIEIGPFVTTKLGQREPYNKVVEKYHPGCPVGCVPVACAMAVSHCVDELKYKGYKYNFTQINKNIINGYGGGDIYNPNGFGTIVDPYITWMDTYEGSTNAISQLLYDFGLDMGTQYSETVSETQYGNAYECMGNIGLTLSNNNLAYNVDNIIDKLNDNWIIFQTGINLNSQPYEKHAWIIDGYQALVDKNTSSIVSGTEYLHCNWGIYGVGNAYYIGDVFTPIEGHDFHLQTYFAIKRSTKE